jgi:hypothetical protein
MRVKLLVHLTGTRNGAEWPGYGEEIDLPDQEARDMIAGGMAQPVTTFRDAEKAVPTPAETRSPLVPKRQLSRRIG